LHWASSI